MSAAIYSKFSKIQQGQPVIISPAELQRVRLRDFREVAKDTGLHVRVQRIRPGWYQVSVQS